MNTCFYDMYWHGSARVYITLYSHIDIQDLDDIDDKKKRKPMKEKEQETEEQTTASSAAYRQAISHIDFVAFNNEYAGVVRWFVYQW